LFWQATFVQDNAHKTVETIDLLRAIEKLLGVISYFSSTSTFIAVVIPILKRLIPGWDMLAKVTVTKPKPKKVITVVAANCLI